MSRKVRTRKRTGAIKSTQIQSPLPSSRSHFPGQKAMQARKRGREFPRWYQNFIPTSPATTGTFVKAS
jgi:hypothetical protein